MFVTLGVGRVDVSSSFAADAVSSMEVVAARSVKDPSTVGEDDGQAPRMEEVLTNPDSVDKFVESQKKKLT